MRVPDGPNGKPTVSASQLRTYGAGGFRLTDQEEEKGCPRQYHAKYVERRVVDDGRSYALRYGSMIHQVLFLMEEEAIGPEEALDRCFPPDLPPEAFKEALDDLTGYLERGASPVDRYGTIAVETELEALLYEDEEFGETYYRGFIDWLGIDLNEPGVLHVVDYKTNRFPPSYEAVAGDVQLKGYAWLVLQNWDRFMPGMPVKRVVVHLDAIKWRDVEVVYSASEIEAWHSWCVAVVRQIHRDEEAKPVLNSGCPWCPVKDDCPLFQALPESGTRLVELKPAADADDDLLLRWREAAWKVKGLLEKAVKEIDGQFQERARAQGGLQTAQWSFSMETEWKDEIDLRALHEAMGDRFYSVAKVSKKAIEDETKGWSPDAVAPVLQCFRRVPVGSKIAKKKRETG